MSERPARRRMTTARAIRAILAFQLGIAAVLFARDITRVLPGLALAPAPPGLGEPVRPGDQTRRYEPRPARPAPGLPGGTGTMPDRLSFTTQPTGTVLLRGAIAEGDGQRFADWLAEHGDVRPTTLRLDSPGGSVADALEIGRAIRAAGLGTELTGGAICLSACPYLLAGGVDRRVSAAAAVGLHQHYFGQSTVLPAFIAVKDIQRGQGAVLVYLAEMGVDPLILRHSLETPPDAIYILLPGELEGYRLATEVTP